MELRVCGLRSASKMCALLGARGSFSCYSHCAHRPHPQELWNAWDTAPVQLAIDWGRDTCVHASSSDI